MWVVEDVPEPIYRLAISLRLIGNHALNSSQRIDSSRGARHAGPVCGRALREWAEHAAPSCLRCGKLQGRSVAGG